MAVLEACTTIKSRLQPYKEANPSGTIYYYENSKKIPGKFTETQTQSEYS
jgi:hypothetical protein